MYGMYRHVAKLAKHLVVADFTSLSVYSETAPRNASHWFPIYKRGTEQEIFCFHCTK